MEFSRLATNDILQNAIQFSNGMVQAPTDPGHGLFPTNENLLEYASDTEMVKPKE
jgi:L-alanine-DL-glutamate epimerase-like enolase superfamily enzyme